jgi:hypothetical protein
LISKENPASESKMPKGFFIISLHSRSAILGIYGIIFRDESYEKQAQILKEEAKMKKIILSCFLLVFASMFISLAEAGEYINNCPVPDNLKIIEPDGNVVPPKLALLSGIWEGNRSSRSVIFIVEQIKSNEAVVVEAWTGQKKRYGASINPGFRRVTCPIEQDDDGNYRIIHKGSLSINGYDI